MKNYPKPTLVSDIQVFINFANFYQRFIQGFSRIATLFILLLKATRLLDLAPKAFRANNNEVIGIGGRANRMIVNLSKNKKFRNLTHVLNIKVIKKSIFLTFNAKKAFNYLHLAFIKATIL